MTLDQIRARLAEIRARLGEVGDELRTINEEAGDSPLEGEPAERWTALDGEYETLTAEEAQLVGRETRLVDIETRARAGEGRPGSIQPPNVNVRDADDPYAVEEVRAYGQERGEEMRGRALTAIEKATHFVGFDDRRQNADDAREAMTRLVEKSEGRHTKGLAEQILLTLDPEYRDAFYKAMAGEHWRMSESERGKFQRVLDHTRAMALADVTGVLVPAFLDPTIVLTSSGTVNPFRARCRVESGTTNVWTGVTTAGITAGWTGAEGTEVGDDAPTFTNPAVTAFMADVFVPISFQAYEDFRGGESEIIRLIVDAKDVLEGTAHATGSGSNQPTGLVTALDANTNVELTTTTSNVFGLIDVYKPQEALPPRWRPRAEWFMNLAIINDIRQFGTDQLSTQTVDLTAEGVPIVLGRRVNEASAMDGTIAVSTTDSIIAYGDPSNYLIFDRVGMMTEFVPNLHGTTNARPVLRRGWLTHWRNGADSINDLAFRLLQAVTNA